MPEWFRHGAKCLACRADFLARVNGVLMIQIKTALRLGRYSGEHLVNYINNVDNNIIDTCPVVDKFKKKYQRTGQS